MQLAAAALEQAGTEPAVINLGETDMFLCSEDS